MLTKIGAPRGDAAERAFSASVGDEAAAHWATSRTFLQRIRPRSSATASSSGW
jgi:hypothetical protein